MPTMDNDKLLQALMIMMKGEPGTYKSTAALSFPTKQYWASIDRKMRALLIPIKHMGINRADIEYDNYSEYFRLKAKTEDLKKRCPYKTIIIDSVTSLGDIINMQTKNEKKGTTSVKTQEEKGYRVGGIAVNTMEDYKAELSAFQDIMADLQDVREMYGCHIIYIAHVIGERKENERGISAHARQIITGGKAVSGKLSAYMEEGYHFDIKPSVDASRPGDWQIFTQHIGDDWARTSLPLDNPIIWTKKNLYKEFIHPALMKMQGENPTSQTTTSTQTNNPISLTPGV